MTTSTELHAHLTSGQLVGECRNIAPRIVCADGFSMSVQASAFHYCDPRDNVGPYDTVEIGSPSEAVEAFMPYCEDPTTPTGTVYAQVPIEVVLTVINKHGGIGA